MRKLLILAVLMTGCYWTANAQATLPSSYYVTKAKKQIEAEEKSKYEDLVFVYTERGALTMLIRDGKVEHYPLKKVVEKPAVWVVPYYSPIKKEDPVEVWRRNVLLFIIKICPILKLFLTFGVGYLCDVLRRDCHRRVLA